MPYLVKNGRRVWQDYETGETQDCGAAGLCHAIVGTETRFRAQNREVPFGGNERMLAAAKRKAEAAGVNIHGKQFSHQLASEPLGVDGWYDGPDDVQRLCEEKGWGLSGSLHADPVYPETADGPYEVADDVVKDDIEAELHDSEATIDDLSTTEYTDLFEKRKTELSGDL